MGLFQTTHWSLVARASGDSPQAREALAQLCRAYRAPVLAYVRTRGYPAESAEDLTQGFFLRLIDRRVHAAADPMRGRFRSFLLTSLQHYLANVRDHARAAKRGGGIAEVSLDDELDLPEDPAMLPEREFDRAWARTVLQRALDRLGIEAARAGKTEMFARLQPFLTEQPDDADYDRIATALGMRRNTVAVAVHRMRTRLREMVKAELAETVAGASDLESELRTLRQLLGGYG